LWYLFVPKCSQLEEKLNIEFNIRLSTDVNKMRRTFPKEMVHVKKLIMRTPGCYPTLEWIEAHDELGPRRRRNMPRRWRHCGRKRRRRRRRRGRAWRPSINGNDQSQ
jgi:hypothetical protein